MHCNTLQGQKWIAATIQCQTEHLFVLQKGRSFSTPLKGFKYRKRLFKIHTHTLEMRWEWEEKKDENKNVV